MNKKDEYQPLTPLNIPQSQRTPICAIYAILNEIYADKDLQPTPRQFKKLAEKIWEMAVKSDTIPGENIDADDLEYSLVGEFFDSKELIKFIIDNKQDINELLDGYEITDADNPDFGGNLITKLKNVSANELYLIPIDYRLMLTRQKVKIIYIGYLLRNLEMAGYLFLIAI